MTARDVIGGVRDGITRLIDIKVGIRIALAGRRKDATPQRVVPALPSRLRNHPPDRLRPSHISSLRRLAAAQRIILLRSGLWVPEAAFSRRFELVKITQPDVWKLS